MLFRSANTPIVRAALDAALKFGSTRLVPRAGSTDANVPMGLGIPAITIGGGGLGTDAHSLREAYDDGKEGWKGPQFVLSIVTTLAGLEGVRP